MATKKASTSKLKSKTNTKSTRSKRKPAKLHIKKRSNSKLAPKRDKLVMKKKLGIFYQVSFSLLLIIFLAVSYFLTIISIDSKEIPLISHKIESSLKAKVGDDVIVGKTHVGFTRYGAFKITIDGLKISTLPQKGRAGRSFFAPTIEGEISLINALMLNFQPKKIKIINPMIVANVIDDEGLDAANNEAIDASFLPKILSSIKTGNILIKNIEVVNAKLLIRGQDENTHYILKHSFIETSVRNGLGYLNSENTIAFGDNKSADSKNIEFALSCSLSDKGVSRCGVQLENFIAASVAKLHPTLHALNNINGQIDAQASFSVAKSGELSNIDFKASSKKGSFKFLKFFKQKMDFEDLMISGLYDHKSRILSLAQIDARFTNPVLGKSPITTLNMSLLISNLGDKDATEFGFNIALKDVPVIKIDQFWPIALNKKGIRKWVISHVNDGVIQKAQAKFSLTKSLKNKSFQLNEIEAKLSFSGAGIDYSYNFPTIDNLTGEAEFNMKGMKITLASGKVLKSKIFNSEVIIEDFRDPNSMLKISGHSQGHAADLLKHAGYNSSFSSEIEKYFNGNSVNSFQVEIPLTKAVTLKNTSVYAKSKITNLTNDYLNGNLLVVSEKKPGNSDFVTKISLTDAEITNKAFDIVKDKGVKSDLNFTVSIQDKNYLQLKNLLLRKKELDSIEGVITGNLTFDLNPFAPIAMTLKNRSFGHNNYDFSYQYDKNISKRTISLKGSQLNFAALIENKLPFKSENTKDSSSSLELHVVSKNVKMLYDKSIENLYVFLNCQSGVCQSLTAKANYGNEQFIDFSSSKESTLGSAKINGHMSDVGYLAEAFGISHAVSNADADVEIINKFEAGKAIIKGDIILKKGVTIYDNAMVKRLAKDDLFSQVKDRIFSNDKTTFNKVKVKFAMNERVLVIKSLIANNFKIGITAKGTIDIENGFYDIKGMIVPGFIVNNLFGIGEIPVIGSVIRGLLTGGQGGGVFGIRYAYLKAKGDKEAKFKTNKVSSFVPTTIKNLFDLI